MPEFDRPRAQNWAGSTASVRRGFLAAAALGCSIAGSASARDVVFFPTPQPVVEKMLEMAKVTPEDVLIDLGSGDGRIPITAAKTFGVRALGVDIDGELVAQSRDTAKREGVADKVEFREQDLFDTDLRDATVVTLFLSHSLNKRLKPRLKELAAGTRIVSYGFPMGSWEPDATEKMNGRYVYLWIVRPSPQTP